MIFLKKRLQSQRGVLLIVFIMGLVLSSMVITTAFFDLVQVEMERRSTNTTQKLVETRRQVGFPTFEVMNEGGANMSYLNDVQAFPANMAAFVGAGYLKHFGTASASYGTDDDAYGNAIALDSTAGSFTIYSFGADEDDDSGHRDCQKTSTGPGLERDSGRIDHRSRK